VYLQCTCVDDGLKDHSRYQYVGLCRCTGCAGSQSGGVLGEGRGEDGLLLLLMEDPDADGGGGQSRSAH